MKPRTLVFILLLALMAVGVGTLRYFVIPTYFPQLLKIAEQSTNTIGQLQPAPSPEPVAAGSIATVSAQLLQDLTPRQKVAQLLAVPVVATNDEELEKVASTAGLIQNEIPGFVTLFGTNISALEADRLTTTIKQLPMQPRMTELLPNLNDQEKKLLQSMIAVDHEGGTVQRLRGEGLTTLPSAEEQCGLDRNSLKSLLDRLGKELRGVGVDIVFAPVVDLGVDHPILKSRLCSDDPAVVKTYGEYWLNSMAAQGVIPVLKHYPGIGQTTVDLHLRTQVIPLNTSELRIFSGLLNTYPSAGVMTTHVILEDAEGEPTAPCTISAECVNLLQLQAPHLIFTDGLEMAGAQGQASSSATVSPQSLPTLAVQAIEAGHNVVVLGRTVPPETTDNLVTELADRYQRNPLFKQKVDQALQTVWQAKYNHWFELSGI